MAPIEPKHHVPPADCLAGRTILVTGASDGIGRVAALTFARFGATAILLGRNVAKLEKVYDEIEAAGGQQPAIFPLDLQSAEEADYQNLADAIEQEFGQLHGLLHNAGLLGDRTSIANYPHKVWQAVMEVNVNAGFLLSKALLPLLKAAPDASILFTSSGVGRKGRAYWGAYAVSKFATEGLSQVMAGELAETSAVRVNCINPGATRTRMRAAAYPAEDPNTVKTPEEIMPGYVFLMGPESKGISGNSFDAQ